MIEGLSPNLRNRLAWSVPDLEELSSFDIVELDLCKHCKCTVTLPDTVCNRYGTVHGGFVSMILDSVAGITIADPHLSQVTLNCSISYLEGVKPQKLTMTGDMVRCGGKVRTLEVCIFAEDGTLLVKATYTMYVAKRSNEETYCQPRNARYIKW